MPDPVPGGNCIFSRFAFVIAISGARATDHREVPVGPCSASLRARPVKRLADFDGEETGENRLAPGQRREDASQN
ncbi:MAG: hypothetical protein ACREE9_14055 [Stellaceae bacterium]